MPTTSEDKVPHITGVGAAGHATQDVSAPAITPVRERVQPVQVLALAHALIPAREPVLVLVRLTVQVTAQNNVKATTKGDI